MPKDRNSRDRIAKSQTKQHTLVQWNESFPALSGKQMKHFKLYKKSNSARRTRYLHFKDVDQFLSQFWVMGSERLRVF